MKNTLNNDYLDSFLDSIWSEQGLSKNTLISYEHDIKSFLLFLHKNKISLVSTEHSDINSFISDRFSKGISSRSNMRLISSLKKFYLFLVSRNIIKKNPTEDIESPRNVKSLPHTIDTESVDRLLNAPDTKNRFGSRDKAMLEILYACGLRVSELVTLKLSQVVMESNFLRVMGKGNKERIIPINDYALAFLKKYIENHRSDFTGKKKSDSLFLLLFRRLLSSSFVGVRKPRGLSRLLRLRLGFRHVSIHVSRHLNTGPYAGTLHGISRADGVGDTVRGCFNGSENRHGMCAVGVVMCEDV